MTGNMKKEKIVMNKTIAWQLSGDVSIQIDFVILRSKETKDLQEIYNHRNTARLPEDSSLTLRMTNTRKISTYREVVPL
jgi:hypothetical protein